MSDKNKAMAKKIVQESNEIRKELQYQEILKWDDGHQTGYQTVDNIIGLEQVIFGVEDLARKRKELDVLLKKQNKKTKKD